MIQRIPMLPKWCLTNKYPAFYDTESKDTLEQTARLYGAMQSLIEDYNKFADEVNTTIKNYCNDLDADQECFKAEITKIAHDYIAMLDEKLKLQDQEIQEGIMYIKENLEEGVKDVINQMKESGELENAIVDAFDGLGGRVINLENEYNQLSIQITTLENAPRYYSYNTLEEMKADSNLVSGDIVKTIGYYEANDGGGATYKIRTKIVTDEENGVIHFIGDTLVAELIIENNRINIKQLGAKNQDKTNAKYDIKPYIQKYLNLLTTKQNRVTLYIPSGVWYCSALEILNQYGFSIEGDNPSWQSYASGGTTICSYEDNQSYIFKVGSSSQMVNNFSIKNITFSSGDFVYYENGNNFRVPDTNTKNIDTALNLYYAGFGIFENLAFNHIIGKVLSFTSSWEMRFDKLLISNCSNINDCLIDFRPIDTSLNADANISNIEILELNVEAINGNIIKTQVGCNLIDSVINNFHFEPFTCNLENCTQHELNDGEFDANSVKHLSLFDINGDCALVVNNIILNNIAYRYIKQNGIQYIYDTIYNITNTSKYAEFRSQVDNIIIQGMKKTLNILLQETEENTVKASSLFCLNNISNTSPYSCIFNVKYFPTIINRAILRTTRNLMRSLMNNCFNAFCDFTRNADNDSRRFLYYDADVINDSMLAVKPIATATGIFCNSSISGSKLNIRAKIENGKTYKLKIYTPSYSAGLETELVGTGKYKTYEIDLTTVRNSFKDNPSCIMYSGSNTEDMDVSLDYFYFE